MEDLNIKARLVEPGYWNDRYREKESIGLQSLVARYLDRFLEKNERLSLWEQPLTEAMVACKSSINWEWINYLMLFTDAANDVLSSCRVYERLQAMELDGV
jgi:hypothetical protein